MRDARNKGLQIPSLPSTGHNDGQYWLGSLGRGSEAGNDDDDLESDASADLDWDRRTHCVSVVMKTSAWHRQSIQNAENCDKIKIKTIL